MTTAPLFFFRFSLGLVLLLGIVFSSSVCRAELLSVIVEGVEGELYTNVTARLKIFLQQENPDVSSRAIRRLHKQAPLEIAGALAPYGYYSVKVDSSLLENDEGWQALYKVNPGNPVVVADLAVEVTGPGRERSFFDDLAAAFPLQTGDSLRDSLYETGKKRILALAVALGYVQARFTEHEVRVKPDKAQAEIRLSLETGSLYHFGETASDQDIITPELFQRFIPYQQGDVYSIKSLSRLQSDLYATGYFSQVLVEPDFSGDEDENIPVEVRLLPAKLNRYSFGVGYGTDTGFRGSLGWKNRIINRQGHKPSFSMQLSERRSRVNAEYDIPLFDPRYYMMGLEAQYLDDTWDDTWTKLLSAGLSVNYNTPKLQYGAGLSARHEKYTVGVTSGSADLLMPTGYWSLILAKDRINTRNGIRFSGSIKAAEKTLLSTTSFVQFLLSSKAIITPLENWRILGRVAIGATAMDSLDDLPPSLRFYAGGDQSVRGYGYRELGPVDSSGVVIGGRYLMDSSIEVERRLTDMWSLAAFFDVGNAFNDIEDDLKQGAGIGVRMTLPFGQVRFDVASALSEEGKPFRVHLSVGADL